MAHVRKTPDERANEITAAALAVARSKGLAGATRTAVAATAGCSLGLVSHYFPGKEGLQAAIIGAAVEAGNAKIVRQGLDMGYEIKAPRDLLTKARALRI